MNKGKHIFLCLTRHFGGKVAPHMRLSPSSSPLTKVGGCVSIAWICGGPACTCDAPASVLHQTRTCGYAFDVTHFAGFMKYPRNCVTSNARGYREQQQQRQIVDIVTKKPHQACVVIKISLPQCMSI